jgi:hypothetical protein
MARRTLNRDPQFTRLTSAILEARSRGVAGDQSQPVNALRQHGKFPVTARLTIPAFAIQAHARGCFRHRTLEIILDLCLFCYRTLAEPCNIHRYEKPERKASGAQHGVFPLGGLPGPNRVMMSARLSAALSGIHGQQTEPRPRCARTLGGGTNPLDKIPPFEGKMQAEADR